ncbi:MAG TPA: hypothetical protein VFC00_04055 [Micromonosporaceae bacterium]|nr:hypothetical protein [Micromonosporaceae bacterium]
MSSDGGPRTSYEHVYVVVRYDPIIDPHTPIEQMFTLAKAYHSFEQARRDADRLNQLAKQADRECHYWVAITRLMSSDADLFD